MNKVQRKEGEANRQHEDEQCKQREEGRKAEEAWRANRSSGCCGMTEVEVVREIIEEELNDPQNGGRSGGRIHKLCVIGRIRSCVYPCILAAKLLEHVPEGYDEGIRDMYEGAKFYYNDAIRSLAGNKKYSVKDGWICRCVKQGGGH